MFEWTYSGINASILRSIEPECIAYLTPKRRIIETFFIAFFTFCLMKWCLRRMTNTLHKAVPCVKEDRPGKIVLLCLTCLVFGCEIGFKLMGKTFIYILNPCHITTIAEIYLLAAESSSPAITIIFRLVITGLNGPVLSYVFPETECRPMFVDKAVYYIQHGLMVAIPYYLMSLGGVYSVEPLQDMSWAVFGYAVSLLYHFFILQGIGLLVGVNLNHMLCPAILDPFQGQNYRLWASIHQLLLIPLLYKLFCISGVYLFAKSSQLRTK